MREDTCPLCLDLTKDRARPIETLACGHTLHLECALGAIRCGNLTCPLCRTPVTSPPRLQAAVGRYQAQNNIDPNNFEFPTNEWAPFYFESETDAADEAPQIMSPLRGGTFFSRFIVHRSFFDLRAFVLNFTAGPGVFSRPPWEGSPQREPHLFVMHSTEFLNTLRFEVHLCWTLRGGVRLDLVYYTDSASHQPEVRSAFSLTHCNGVREAAVRGDVLFLEGRAEADNVAHFVSHDANRFVTALTRRRAPPAQQ
jgi:hypothetical protein